MVECYRECGNVLLRAQALFLERYGRRPSLQTILGAVQRHQDYGVYIPPAADVGRQRVSARIEDDILDFFLRHPMASTADAARQTRFSVNVWAGLLGDRLLGPVFLDRLNGQTYNMEFLTGVQATMLEDIPLILIIRLRPTAGRICATISVNSV